MESAPSCAFARYHAVIPPFLAGFKSRAMRPASHPGIAIPNGSPIVFLEIA